MKPTMAMAALMVAAAVIAMGQNSKPASNTQAPGGASQTQPSITNPKGKHPPSAKTKQEYDAYAAAAGKPDAASMEAAAREFEVQFPNSELLPLLFQQALDRYQKADNSDKALDMGRKVLQYDPDNTFALVMNATVLAENTRETDIDRDQRLKEADTDAQRALDNIQSGNFLLAPNATPEQVEQFKNQVTSMAYNSLGTAAMVRKDNAAAEQNFRKALNTSAGKTDPYLWYRLALALDRQGKYTDGNGAITMAVALAPANSQVAKMAAAEQSRLKQLMVTASAPPATAAPKAQDRPQPETVQSK